MLSTRSRPRQTATPGVAAFVVVVVLLLFAVAGTFAWRAQRQQNELREANVVDRARSALETSLIQAVAPVQGIQAIVEEGELSLRQFRAYAGPILSYPGVTAVAVELVVPAGERERFEEEWGFPIVDQGSSGLVPAPARSEYFPVVAVVPDTETFRSLRGFDFNGDEVRRATAREARATGELVLSEVIPLASNGELGFLAIQPLVSAADGSTFGFVSVGFLVEDMVGVVSSQVPEGVRYEFGQGDRALASTPERPSDGGGLLASLLIGRKEWWVRAEDLRFSAPVLPLTLYGAGAALALLLGLLFAQTFRFQRSLMASRESLARAEQMTADLQRLTARLSRSVTPSDVAATVLAGGRELLEASSAAIAVLPPDDSRLELVLAHGASSDEIDLGPGAPLGRAARTGRSVWLTSQGAIGDGGFGDIACVGLPLRVGDSVFGAVEFRFEPSRRFSPAERVQVAVVADQAGQALQRARLFELERDVAAKLQNALLPVRLPQVSGVEMAGRYLAAMTRTGVGGDWYDAVELPDGRVAVILGDVVGRGAEAAAVMGQLRSAAHLLALRGEPPGSALLALDRFAMSVEGASGSTLVYAVYDPSTGGLTYARAGHPPPLLVEAEATCRFLTDGAVAPVGFGLIAEVVEGAARLAPDSMVLLYSDGAVERRGEEITHGMARLAAGAVGAAGQDAHQLCESVVDAVMSEVTSFDDLALLSLRRLP